MNKFLRIATWKQIIQSRFLYWKNKDKDWYKERKAICDVCPHNSGFEEKKDFRGKLLNILYHKKEYCKICFCVLALKQSVPEASCGKEEIGEKPEWRSIWE